MGVVPSMRSILSLQQNGFPVEELNLLHQDQSPLQREEWQSKYPYMNSKSHTHHGGHETLKFNICAY